MSIVHGINECGITSVGDPRLGRPKAPVAPDEASRIQSNLNPDRIGILVKRKVPLGLARPSRSVQYWQVACRSRFISRRNTKQVFNSQFGGNLYGRYEVLSFPQGLQFSLLTLLCPLNLCPSVPQRHRLIEY